MRYCIVFFLTTLTTCAMAQAPLEQLTVEKIMQDPKWIGNIPSGGRWLIDGSLVFRWNPEGWQKDSLYRITTDNLKPLKLPYPQQNELVYASQLNFNSTRSAFAYELKGDIYFKSGKKSETKKVTNTLGRERLHGFACNDECLVFEQYGNLYAWSIKDGSTTQLSDVRSGNDPALKKQDKVQEQEKQLEVDQLALFQELNKKYEAEEAEKRHQKMHPEPIRIKPFYLGERRSRHLSISASGRSIAMVLSEKDQHGKRTIVPNYVTLTGFTEDIQARPKVGEIETPSDLVLYVPEKDTFIRVVVTDLPGMNVSPTFLENYKSRDTTNMTTKSYSVTVPEWSPWKDEAILQVYSHDNKDRWIIWVNALTGQTRLIEHQHDEAWIGGPGIGGSFRGGDIGWLDKDHIWFQSETTGYSHLYVWQLSSGEKSALTSGKYEVQEVIVTQNGNAFYLVTNESHPGKKEVTKITWPELKKSTIVPATGGLDNVHLSPDEQFLTYRASSATRPWELYLRNLNKSGTAEQITNMAASDKFVNYPWRIPEVITIAARDGEKVYARLYRPDHQDPLKPAVVFVHGAGYLQNAHHWWSSYFREYMFHNLLVDRGYTVLDMDYRASSGYGRDWRTAIYRHMGGKDLEDNVDGARYLVDSLGINPERIGIYGGSYGGFITLMAMFTTPDVFAAGAALRPVTDWAHYNHGYTSNILNTPVEDSIAFARSSPIFFAEGLKGDLLICHGMLDVNVHFQDVVRLQQRLIELGKDNWEVAAYPLEDHGFEYPSSWTDEYKRILALFERTLRDK